MSKTKEKESTSISVTEKALETEATAQTETWTDRVKVYIGPTIMGVTTGTVYNNGYPGVLLDYIAETPAIEKLLVSIRDLATAQSELRDPATGKSHVYELINKKYNKK